MGMGDEGGGGKEGSHLVVLAAGLGGQDGGVVRVGEVAEQQLLVLQCHGQHAIQPGGHLLRHLGVLPVGVLPVAIPALAGDI